MWSWARTVALVAALSFTVVACGDNEVTMEGEGTGSPGVTPAVTATPTRTATPTDTGEGPTRTPTPTVTATPSGLCGNGVIDSDEEECDGADLDDNECFDLCFDQDDEGGTLRCNDNCTFDFSGCLGTDCEP